jgi:hypothetical protein
MGVDRGKLPDGWTVTLNVSNGWQGNCSEGVGDFALASVPS